MVIKRVAPLRFAKVLGFLYVVMGLLFGGFFALMSFAVGSAAPSGTSPVLGAFFGIGAIILLPICYGILGFVFSLLAAALYNWAASLIGGIEIQLEAPPGSPDGI